MDHFFVGAFIRRRGAVHGQVAAVRAPMQFIYKHGGVFPVRRGYRDEEAFITAHSILERGGLIVMYCEGGRSRTGKLSEQPKRGIGRLALESGATIVPVAIHGSSRVRNWKKPAVPEGHGPVRRADALRGGSTSRRNDQQQQAADEIFAADPRAVRRARRARPQGRRPAAARARRARPARRARRDRLRHRAPPRRRARAATFAAAAGCGGRAVPRVATRARSAHAQDQVGGRGGGGGGRRGDGGDPGGRGAPAVVRARSAPRAFAYERVAGCR